METLPEYHKIIFDDLRKERDELKAINGELLKALEMVRPYIHDIQSDNYTDASVGIFGDAQLTKAFNFMELVIEKSKPSNP